MWGEVSATKGIIYSSTPLGCNARRFGEVASRTPRPRCEPRTLGGWQNVIAAAAPKFGIDLEKKNTERKREGGEGTPPVD